METPPDLTPLWMLGFIIYLSIWGIWSVKEDRKREYPESTFDSFGGGALMGLLFGFLGITAIAMAVGVCLFVWMIGITLWEAFMYYL